MYRVKIEGLPKIVSNGSQGSWFTKHNNAKLWHRKVYLALSGFIPDEPYIFLNLIMTRASSSEPDYDNLVISGKPVIDGLVRAGIVVNDKQKNILCKYQWEKCRPKDGHIILELEGFYERPMDSKSGV
jgi:hypothetical protein